MKASRILPVLNLIGCLAITGIIVTQWLREVRHNEKIERLGNELSDARALAEAERKRADTLQGDVDQLKDSVESIMQARREAEEDMAARIAASDARVEETAKAAEEQIASWQKAVADRDARIRQLDSQLAATRERLDEAIGKLKEAGAR